MEPLQNNQESVSQNEATQETVEEVDGVNFYPTIRHLFLILCILLTISIILFLFYQNGKSIYDNGI